MKNFYNSKLELENKKDRVILLKHDIEDIKLKLVKITSSVKEDSSSSNRVQSKIHVYTTQKIAKEEEIKELEEQIDYLEPIINRMERRVDAMVGIHKEVFEKLYKDNMKIKDIASDLNYSSQRIYQLKDEVNQFLGIEWKIRKYFKSIVI